MGLRKSTCATRLNLMNTPKPGDVDELLAIQRHHDEIAAQYGHQTRRVPGSRAHFPPRP